MFHNDDEVIEFLEETMEIKIPAEVLKDKDKTIDEIENTLNIRIPDEYRKKTEINKYIKNSNDEFKNYIDKKRPKKIINFIYLILILLIPTLYFLINISKNSNYISLNNLKQFFEIMIYIITGIVLIMSSGYIIQIIKVKRFKLGFKKIFSTVIIIVYTIAIIVINNTIYNNESFKDFLIKKSMNTLNHQYIASIFYNHRTIENSLSKVETDNTQLYEFESIDYETKEYANKYDEEILTKENEDDIYKLIKVEGILRDGVSKYSGYLVAVYDPSHVKIGTSVGAGTTDKAFGQILSQISKNNDALVAMNGGGFYDPQWSSNGGIPHGIVIKDGKVMTVYNRGIDSGGLIALTNDNKLILKRMSVEEALAAGVRDAVDWGPYLIVNGKNYFKEEKSRWACARTVIGQRKDGIILLLVIDGSQPHSVGASYSDLADIMERYGAINAANLDGGTSTSMTVNHEYINIPFNGQRRTIRSLPNAWIVTK